MSDAAEIDFHQPDLVSTLDALGQQGIDALPFGVIGFDADGVVRRYNATEIANTGLTLDRAVGHNLFTVVAQCMNNFMVAQRFDDAQEAGRPLDATIDYVLTWRMRPVKVKLRMLAQPGGELRYVLLERR